MLQIFEQDPFQMASLTEAINILPYVPNRIGAMGLFAERNPTTHTVFLERKGNVISLLTTKPRGSGETNKKPANSRDVLPIMIPHVPYVEDLLASDLSGLRGFDTETQTVTASEMLNDKLSGMRQDHEVTHEYFRLGAIKGRVLDGDGTTTLVDLFSAFGITQGDHYFNLEGDGEGIKQECIDVIRAIESSLGGATYDHIHAFCGNDFFDQLSTNEEVKKSHAALAGNLWAMMTQGQGTQGRGTSQIMFGDITFENYRGKVGDVDFIESDVAHFFPVGVPNLFREFFGPANTMDDVNTPGKPIYAQQKPKEWNEGIDIRTESNPLMLCVRPSVLRKGWASTSST
jgi:hypothetical protein